MKKEKSIAELQEQCVRVFFWMPKVNDTVTTSLGAIMTKIGSNLFSSSPVRASVGHVVVQTPTRYGSFWPDTSSEKKPDLKHPFQIVEGDFIARFEDDVALEKGRRPDSVVSFFSLDVALIDEELETLQRSGAKYVLAGDATISPFLSVPTLNCAKLVARILFAGGFRDLIGLSTTERTTVLSPDRLYEWACRAKRNEMAGSDEYRSITLPNNRGVPEAVIPAASAVQMCGIS